MKTLSMLAAGSAFAGFQAFAGSARLQLLQALATICLVAFAGLYSFCKLLLFSMCMLVFFPWQLYMVKENRFPQQCSMHGYIFFWQIVFKKKTILTKKKKHKGQTLKKSQAICFFFLNANLFLILSCQRIQVFLCFFHKFSEVSKLYKLYNSLSNPLANQLNHHNPLARTAASKWRRITIAGPGRMRFCAESRTAMAKS